MNLTVYGKIQNLVVC